MIFIHVRSNYHANFLGTRRSRSGPKPFPKESEVRPKSHPQMGAKVNPKVMWIQGLAHLAQGGARHHYLPCLTHAPWTIDGPRAPEVPGLLYYIPRMANAATPAATASVRPASVIAFTYVRKQSLELIMLLRTHTPSGSN